MQIRFKKNLFFFLLVLSIPTASKTQTNGAKQIDSLSKIDSSDKVLKTIELNTTNAPLIISKNTLLKAAFIYEKKENYIKALYFLSVAYKRNPSTNLLNKINDVATKHNLEGYETDDWGFVILLFRNYFYYIYIIILLLGVYVFSVVLFKFRKTQFIPNRHKWTVLVYLVSLFILLNIPKSYSVGIIGQRNTSLRQSASSASPITEVIQVGNKINIVGQKDEWYRIFWHKKFSYIRKIDVLIIY